MDLRSKTSFEVNHVYTVVILINATTLMHKSTLARITSRIIILDKSTRNKIFLELLGDIGVCLKIFQRKEQKLENAFFHSFENFVTSKS